MNILLKKAGLSFWPISKPKPHQDDGGPNLQERSLPRSRPVTHDLFIVLPPPLCPLLVVNHHASKLPLMLPSLVPHRGEAKLGASTWGMRGEGQMGCKNHMGRIKVT